MLVTLTEAAGLTGRSIPALKRLIKAGRLPFTLNEGVYSIDQYSLLEFLPSEENDFRSRSQVVFESILNGSDER